MVAMNSCTKGPWKLILSFCPLISVLGRPEDYATLSTVSDIEAVLARFTRPEDPLILICHSYGCCIGTHVALRASIPQKVMGMVFLCPKAILSEKDRHDRSMLLKLPNWLVTLTRALDRWGGIHSNSVNRFLSPSAPLSLREKQVQWNQHLTNDQLRAIVKHMQWVTSEEYKNILCPVLLLGGAQDRTTPPEKNLPILHELLTIPHPDPYCFPKSGHQPMLEEPEQVYSLIQAFLMQTWGFKEPAPERPAEDEDNPMNKWSLKNYVKWKATSSVSELLKDAQGISIPLRGMKLLRQVDQDHSPKMLAKLYPKVKLVIDLTQADPSYDPRSLTELGIQYRKLSTKSKVPPSKMETQSFILLLRDFWVSFPHAEAVVHCHYGFNRTGFMISSYLIQEQKMTIDQAIAAFATARPNGIKYVSQIFFKKIITFLGDFQG
jgi:pimeloyl-ACP methyl ester carboxylesterase